MRDGGMEREANLVWTMKRELLRWWPKKVMDAETFQFMLLCYQLIAR